MTKDAPVSKRGRATVATAPAVPSRRFRLCTLGAVMPSVVRPALHRRPGLIVTIIMDWLDIVGPDLASVSAARKLVAGTLTVACAGPTALEFNYQGPQLIERINRHCGQSIVERLKIVQDFTIAPSRPRRARPAPPPVEVAGIEDDALREVLGRLGARIRERARQR